MVLGIFTSGFLVALECTKFVFSRPRPNPAGGPYSAPPGLLAGLRGLTFKGREREGGRRGEREGKRRGREGEGREREEPAPLRKFLDPSLHAVNEFFY